MNGGATAVRARSLDERLRAGITVLFDMEQRGDTGDEYRRWLQVWLDLLQEYEDQESVQVLSA